jgi:hypothetical protein
MQRVTFWMSPTLVAVSMGLLNMPGEAASRSQSRYARSTPSGRRLATHQGSYFRFALPAGWRFNETPNGVDLMAPDGSASVSSALLIGGWGNMTPRGFIEIGNQAGGLSDARLLSCRSVPSRLSTWRAVEAEMTATVRGTPFRGHVTSAVQAAYGRFSGVIVSYGARSERWSRDKGRLAQVAQSITITNPGGIGMQDQVMLPQNRPLESVFGNSTRDWEARGRIHDRLSRQRQETTMGYQRMMDPETGRMYNMPHSAYDPTRGGYVNPKRPTELLVRPPVGQ